MADAHSTPESGTLPGRYEFVREPAPMAVPDDPEWNRFSDNIREFSGEPGASYGRQDGVGTADARDHHRGSEEPSLTIGYDLQRFFVDTDGNPQDAAADGILRGEYNELLNTHLAVERTETPGGNDGAGIRIYTVGRGCAVESVEATLDPSEENPILMELEYQPRKVRSYAIHQPAEPTTVSVTSDSDLDSEIDVTIEDEDAETTETITMGGTTTADFGDIDAVWLSEEPAGDVTIEAADETVLMELAGGLTYSDDEQPVDGDRGVPALGGGSHADPVATTYEHFVGDRIERPVGSPIRPRLNSASWTVENDLSTEAVHASRAPTVDASNRTVQVEADVAGPKASHDSMMESLQKVQNDLEHELSGGIVRFKNTIVEESGERTREADGQAVASLSETFTASGVPSIELEATA